MEKIVEIANFRQADRAELLASLLRSEGIDCYVRNEMSSRVFGGLVDIGARVELLESDLPRALEIMKIGGFSAEQENPDESMTYDLLAEVRNNTFLGKKMLIIISLLVIVIALIIYFSSSLSSPKY